MNGRGKERTNERKHMMDLAVGGSRRAAKKRKTIAKQTVQGSRIRFVLGCMIPRAGAVARSRNLGQALFGSPVFFVPHVRLVLASRGMRPTT